MISCLLNMSIVERMIEIMFTCAFYIYCTLKTISHIAIPISDFVDDASCGESSDTDVHDFHIGSLEAKRRDGVVILFRYLFGSPFTLGLGDIWF